MKPQLVSLAAIAWLSACASQPNASPPTGAETFARHCASCHGALGDGTSTVADVFTNPMPDLTMLARRNGGTFPADRVASYVDGRSLPPAHGSRTMPIWGTAFDPAARNVIDATTSGPRVADVVEYLRTLQR